MESAIHEDVLTGNVTCILRTQECTGIAELFSRSKAFCWNFRLLGRDNVVNGPTAGFRRGDKTAMQAFGAHIRLGLAYCWY